jgi:addiction module HigA family antidote
MTYRVICQGWSFGGGGVVGFIGLLFCAAGIGNPLAVVNNFRPGRARFPTVPEEFLLPLGTSQYRLAKEVHVPARRINGIVLEKWSISADTALRLGRYLGTTAQFWLNLQARYDLELAREGIKEELETEIKPFKSAA